MTPLRGCILLVLVALLVAGCAPAPGTGAVWAVEEDNFAATQELEQKLTAVLPKLQFPGIGFGDVLQFFREVSKMNIHPRWEALRAANIDAKTQVNVMLTEVTVAKALRVILDDVGGVNPLDYVVSGGVLTISTRDDLSRSTVTRIYDVSDILASLQGMRVTSPVATPPCICGKKAGHPREPIAVKERPATHYERVEALAGAIRAGVAPMTWRGGDTGGMIGSIREFDGKLVIVQTLPAHRQVHRLLEALRERAPVIPPPSAPKPPAPTESPET